MVRHSHWISACLLLFSAGNGMATPANKKALANHLDTTCHLPSKNHAPESLDKFPHNAFGDALRKLGEDSPLPDRIDQAANQDSDGDGVSNLTELLLGTFPGDKSDKPTEAQFAKAGEKADSFARFLQRYPWKPFQPVKHPEVPAVAHATLEVANPIDSFVSAQQEQRGLKAQAEADRLTLLRRVYLDLIGLSPTPEQQAAFLADTSPQAYEKVVGRLLDDPRYGERWARHWMDVWRYSDWDGYKDMVRISQPHVWRWRDWIIDALNDGKPYDRMVQEMLAADELAPEDLDALRAEASDGRAALVSIMWANNETGVIAPMREIVEIAHAAGALVHTDAVQAVGKLPINLREVPVDYLSLSGHKFHGPKGVGALFVSSRVRFQPLLVGGGQEGDRRSGTENVPGIVGLGCAASLAGHALSSELRDGFEAQITEGWPEAVIHGQNAERLPNVSSICFPELDAAGLLILLDKKGVACAAGSACHAASLHPSHVLEAMGYSAEHAASTLRFSFSRFNTAPEVAEAAGVVLESLAKLRSILGLHSLTP